MDKQIKEDQNWNIQWDEKRSMRAYITFFLAFLAIILALINC